MMVLAAAQALQREFEREFRAFINDEQAEFIVRTVIEQLRETPDEIEAPRE